MPRSLSNGIVLRDGIVYAIYPGRIDMVSGYLVMIELERKIHDSGA